VLLTSLVVAVGCTSPSAGPSPSPSPSPTVAHMGCGPAPVPARVAASAPGELFSVDLSDFPRIDGSTATQPLALGFVESFTGTNLTPQDVPFNKTHQAYLNLIAADTDIILVTSPSQDELAAAKQAGVELEVIPVVNEAFVFLTNAGNEVTDLTVDQLRDIYSGKITSWKQVGGPDGRILAYQRPENSGSQTGMLDLVMKGTAMVKAPRMQISTMDGLVDVVADFDGGTGTLGYSYYYYVTAMYGPLAIGQQQDGVQLLSVEGVAPTPQTVKDGTYPLTSAYYIVIRADEPAGSTVRRVADAMLSPHGQAVAQQAGYVPVGDVAELVPPLPYTPPLASAPCAVTSLEETWTLYPVTVNHTVRDGVDALEVGGLADKAVAEAITAGFAKTVDGFRASHPGLEPWLCAAETCWRDGTWWEEGGRFELDAKPLTVKTYGNVMSFYVMGGEWPKPVVGPSFNVRLDTGEVFTWYDVFTDQVSIEAVLADVYRDKLIPPLDPSDIHNRGYPADVEVLVMDMLSDYRGAEDLTFRLTKESFSSPGDTRYLVTVEFGNYGFCFPLVDYWESVAAVHRFATEDDSLRYTGTPVTGPVFVPTR